MTKSKKAPKRRMTVADLAVEVSVMQAGMDGQRDLAVELEKRLAKCEELYERAIVAALGGSGRAEGSQAGG